MAWPFYIAQQYDLPVIETPIGVIWPVLRSELAGLTIPSANTLTLSQDFIERYDALQGVTEVESVDVDFADDYSTYAEGFWFKVCQRYFEIRFILIGLSGPEFLFWGKINSDNSNVHDFDLSSGNYQKDGSFTLLSLLADMQAYPVASAISTLQSYSVDDGTGVLFSTIANGLFSCLKTGIPFDIPFTPSDVIFENSDLRFTEGASPVVWQNCETALFKTQAGGVAAGMCAVWSTQMADGWGIFKGIANTFRLLPRVTYDISSGHVQLRLTTRSGHGSNLSFDTPIQSDPAFSANSIVRAASCTRQSGVADIAPSSSYITQTGVWMSGSPAASIPNDLSVAVQFELGSSDADTLYMRSSVDNSIVPVRQVDYYDLMLNNWISTFSPYVGVNTIQEAIERYSVRAFIGRKTASDRTYFGSLRAQDGTLPMYGMRTSINNGDGAEDYVAVEVAKNVQKGTLRVRWNKRVPITT